VSKKSTSFSESNLPFIGLEHIAPGDLLIRGTGDSSLIASQVTLFKPGDILYGKLRPYFRKSSITRFKGGCSTEVLVLRPKKGFSRGFAFALISSSFFSELATLISTGTGLPRAQWNSMKSLTFEIPSDDVCEILGEIADDINSLRHVQNTTNQFISEIINSIFRSWFIDFDPVKAKSEGRTPYGMNEETAALFPDSFEDSDFGLIPKGWKLQQLSDIAQIVDCSHATKPEPIDTGYGVLLHVWNIDDSGGITLHETFEVEENEFNSWASRMVLGEGDCVVTKTGRVAAVGRIPHNLDRNLAMGRNMIGIRMENAPGFLYAYLTSPLKEMEVIKWLNSGTVMPSLHVKYAERLSVIVPSKDILAKFEELVGPLIRVIDDSRAESISLSSCRDVLLPRLMSGELSVS